MIHPVQIIEPNWQQFADEDNAMAMATHKRFIVQICDSGSLILGTHFNTPITLRIIDKDGGCRISVRDLKSQIGKNLHSEY